MNNKILLVMMFGVLLLAKQLDASDDEFGPHKIAIKKVKTDNGQNFFMLLPEEVRQLLMIEFMGPKNCALLAATCTQFQRYMQDLGFFERLWSRQLLLPAANFADTLVCKSFGLNNIIRFLAYIDSLEDMKIRADISGICSSLKEITNNPFIIAAVVENSSILFGSYAKRVGKCGLMFLKLNFPVIRYAMTLKFSYPLAFLFAA